MRRERSQSASRQPRERVSQAAHTGVGWRSLASVWPTRLDHTSPIATCRDSSHPHQVLIVSLSALAKPVSTKKTISREIRATGFHFTQAEMARVTSETTRIQAQLPMKIAAPIRRVDA